MNWRQWAGLLVAGAIALCLPFRAAGAAAADAAPHRDPKLLGDEIGKLSAVQWRDRRDAVAWLIDAGPTAELPLRHLLERTTNPEARTRAERVLKKIEQIRRIEPAIVTLDLDRVPVAQAFERVAEIEGAELPTDPPDLLEHCQGTISARYAGQTYWQAMLDLAKRAGLALRCDDAGVRLVRPASRTETAPDAIAASGLFLVRARLIRWTHDVRDPGRSVRLEVYAEPRAEIVRADWRVPLEEATDQRGQALRPLAESGINMGGATRLAGGGYAWYVPLRPIAVADTRLVRLRGSVDVVLAEQVVTGQAPDFPGDHTMAGPMPIHLACGGASARVERVVNDDPKAWTMEMRLDTDPAEVDWDAVTGALATGGLRVFDADGREFALRSFWRAGGGPSNAIHCKWGPPDDNSRPRPGDPFKLTWRVPGKTVPATVSFDLSDVHLAE